MFEFCCSQVKAGFVVAMSYYTILDKRLERNSSEVAAYHAISAERTKLCETGPNEFRVTEASRLWGSYHFETASQQTYTTVQLLRFSIHQVRSQFLLKLHNVDYQSQLPNSIENSEDTCTNLEKSISSCSFQAQRCKLSAIGSKVLNNVPSTVKCSDPFATT